MHRPPNVLGSQPVPADLERFLSLVCRELGAEAARVIEPGVAPSDDHREISARIPDGRGVIARFAEPPIDRGAKQRHLEMLASTFDTVVDEAATGGHRARPPVATSLHEELVTLCARAAAVNVVVIDANSPVVWGAAHPEGVVVQSPLASSPRMAEAPANDETAGEPTAAIVARRAVQNVRALPELAALRKGRHLRHIERDGEAPLLAHAFATIYVLVVVFAAPFDELRAERAVIDALPRVERLVLALPPLDPQPFQGGGVVAMRRPRRR
jgi:hypothetical protein